MSEIEELEPINDKKVIKSSAVTVLEAQMIFYHEKAEELIVEIIEKLKELRARPETVVVMYKEFEKCAERARECAAKLAPYQSPRLESIETKQKIEHKFVIKAPSLIDNSEQWLEHASKEQKLIEAQANGSV